jgi:hypothetical protein
MSHSYWLTTRALQHHLRNGIYIAKWRKAVHYKALFLYNTHLLYTTVEKENKFKSPN